MIMKNEITVTKKKHCYEIKYKGQVRYCPEDKVAEVVQELLERVREGFPGRLT
jgi:hypothetical protein